MQGRVVGPAQQGVTHANDDEHEADCDKGAQEGDLVPRLAECVPPVPMGSWLCLH